MMKTKTFTLFQLRCCGSDNYTTWFDIKWDGNSTISNSVPTSCCIKKQCANTNLPKNASPIIYTRGCYEMVTSFTQKNFSILGGVAIGFCFLQLFGSLFACCLARVINKAKYEQVA
ncbi:hypothetical protein LSAT2_024815 [Lamellibrachia satsuma]|nr:hypothetical protein LSAT2_024815 [Lamellibrachia satsuma]